MLPFFNQVAHNRAALLGVSKRYISMDFTRAKDPSGMIIERWTTKEQREYFYELIGNSFFHSTLSKRHLPDEKKRRKFLPAYFRYSFENKITSDKVFLGALKKDEIVDGKHVEDTVYVGLYGLDTTPGPPADPSEILSIYKEGAERMMMRDQWMQETIYTPLRTAVKDLGTEAWILAHQATIGKHRRHRYAADFGMKVVEIARRFGIEKRKLENGKEFKIKPFHTLIAADTYPAALQQFDKIGLETVGHYHFNYQPGLKCYLDSGMKGDEEDIACHLLMVEKRVAADVREKLQAYRPSL